LAFVWRTLIRNAVFVTAAACSSPPDGGHAPGADAAGDERGDGAGATAVIVGVQSEPLNGAIDSLHIVTTVGGSTNSDERLGIDALPKEIRLDPLPGAASAPVQVQVSGFLSAVGTQPLLLRSAETSFEPGHTKLLRVLLQGQCLLALPGGPPGAPSCGAPQTCIGGSCQDDWVNPPSLEEYSASWVANTPDVCKPAGGGPPVVQVGTGQTDYLPLTDGQTIQAEQGPQGGHHVWIAVRQENLKQTGSRTTITSVQPTTALAGPRTAVVFTFEQDQGGFCKLSGLRYQLDVDGTDYHRFLGQPLDITVTIVDGAGSTGTGIAHATIASTILCASGMPGCP
jgi:hypothetical protein